MQRNSFPAALDPTARTCTQRGMFSTRLHGVVAWLGLADFVRLTGPQSLCPEARAKTPGIGLARQAATGFYVAGAAFPLSADLETTSPEKLQADVSRAAMRPAMRIRIFGSVRLLTLSGRRQHLKRYCPRFKPLTAPLFSAPCINRIHTHAAGNRRSICHLPSSHELQGTSPVSSTVFGLSWPVRWRGIKCLPPPFA